MENVKSEFFVGKVIVKDVRKHENADTLSICSIDGNPVIFRTGDYKEGNEAVYISVDALVPTDRPQFAFLAKEGKTHHRIKAIKLRGIFSMGLLIPVTGLENSQDLMADLGISKYLSPQEQRESLQSKKVRGFTPRGPSLPVYGLDPARKYLDVLQEGERVVITEKIHGSNFRCVYKNGKLWVGSHKVMRGSSRSYLSEIFNRAVLKIKDILGIKHRAHLIQENGDIWWKIANEYDFKTALRNYPNMVLYGEVYGKGIQDLTYDLDNIKFRAFDVYDLENERFLNFDEFEDFCFDIGLWREDRVPVLKVTEWNEETKAWCKERIEGKSEIAGHLIEGVVIKPFIERKDPHCGRVAIKYVGQNYLLRKEE